MDESVMRAISQIPFLKDGEEQIFSPNVITQVSVGRSPLSQPHKKVLLPITPNMTPKPITIPNEEFIRSQKFSVSNTSILANTNNYVRSRSRSPLGISYLPVSSNSVHVRRSKCRDFYQKGFCMRGDKCFYDHGSDPVVIKNASLNDAVYNSGDALTSSTPCESYVDHNAKEIIEAYNPEAPAFARPANLSNIQPHIQVAAPRSSNFPLNTYHIPAHSKVAMYSVPPPNSFVYAHESVPIVQTTTFSSYSKSYTSSNSSVAAGFGGAVYADISKTYGYATSEQKPTKIINSNQETPKSYATAKLLSVYRKKSELYQMQVDQQRLILTKAQETDDKSIKLKYMELVKRNEEALKKAKDDVEILSQQIIAMRQKQKNINNKNYSTTILTNIEKPCSIEQPLSIIEMTQEFTGYEEVCEGGGYGGIIVKKEKKDELTVTTTTDSFDDINFSFSAKIDETTSAATKLAEIVAKVAEEEEKQKENIFVKHEVDS